MVQLAEHFASDERGRYSEWLRQRQWFIKAKYDHQRRENLADKVDEAAATVSAAVTIASKPQVQEFGVKVETLDLATIKALMENQEILDIVNASIDTMLGRAHVMEDGRRVFKTEDGTQVFDEHGNEIMPDELDFDLLGADLPTHEDYSADIALREELNTDRANILEFQEQVDAARERLDEGEISEAELEELDAELLEMMPDTVRGHAGIALESADAALNLDSIANAAPTHVRSVTQEVAAAAPAPLQ